MAQRDLSKCLIKLLGDCLKKGATRRRKHLLEGTLHWMGLGAYGISTLGQVHPKKSGYLAFQCQSKTVQSSDPDAM